MLKLFGLGASQGPLWGQRVPSFLLFPLPVEENLPVCRRKGRLMDLVCACDGLSPLPVEEKAVSWIGARLGCGWAGLAWAWLDPWRLPWQFEADQGS